MANYQMTIRSGPNKHNNLYQSPLKSIVISLQSWTLHYRTPWFAQAQPAKNTLYLYIAVEFKVGRYYSKIVTSSRKVLLQFQ